MISVTTAHAVMKRMPRIVPAVLMAGAYRVFSLRGEALHPTIQRVYAGLNLAF